MCKITLANLTIDSSLRLQHPDILVPQCFRLAFSLYCYLSDERGENLKILTTILVFLTALGIPALALIGDYQCKKAISGLFKDF